MTRRDIIVLGASLGGVEALKHLVHGLPPGLPAALYVVCHIGQLEKSYLPEILSRSGPLLATHAQDGEPIRYGQITVAPPDRHLILAPEGIRLTHGPRENRHRPAIDPLFRSAARSFGQRVIGVVLTGSLTDGAAGLLAIRTAGGIAVVQDPAEAFAPSMPQTARDVAGADYVLRLAEIAPLLTRLVQQPSSRGGGKNMIDPLEKMPHRIEHDMTTQQGDGRRGELTIFTCPECGGSMWQVDERELARFRCHTGHVYYGDVLLAEQSEALEAALWSAVRIFKEKMVLARQLATRERQLGNADMASRYDEEAAVAERYGTLIQQHVLGTGTSMPTGPVAVDPETDPGTAPVTPPKPPS
jgi:two-component system chemotaxis response regulator CheB